MTTTVTETRAVTTNAEPGPTLDSLLLKSKDPLTLNGAAFALITAGQYQRALPFARKAMHWARPGDPTLGYATFNTGYALLGLERCSDALPYLRRARKLEPKTNRQYIDPRITAAKQCAQGGASAPAQSHSSGAQQDSSRVR